MGVTLSEVAELAQVSVGTVSKVLNGRPGVSDATRDRVRALLEERGYRRRGLRPADGGGVVDLVMASLDSAWAQPIVVGAEEAAARAGYGLLVTSTHLRRAGNVQWVRNLARRRPDAVVLFVSDLRPEAEDHLGRLDIPFVMVDSVDAPRAGVPTVTAANRRGARVATEHLLGLGHRHVAHITGPLRLACSRDRLDGYREGLRRARIPERPELLLHGDFSTEAGRRAGAELLDLDVPPTAIFAGSDQQAHGVYAEAAARGIRIPEDLSVVGFDDLEISRWISPPLTTVRQHLADMAGTAVRMAVQVVQGTAPAVHVELPTELVVRRSTAPPSG